MKNKDENKDEIEALLNSFLHVDPSTPVNQLRKLFELKLNELNISRKRAQEIIGVETRGLNGLLDGTIRFIDVEVLKNLSNFLEREKSEILTLFDEVYEKNHPRSNLEIEKINFIIKNFDLKQLKKEKIIKSTNDFEHIEKSIVEQFGFDDIFQFKTESSAFYSSNKLFKGGLMTDYWKELGATHIKYINNRFEYSRKALIDYFPTIRWHCMNVENGLKEVIKSLYKIGITVIYQPKFSTLHVNGATIAVNGKPGILLTNQRDFYPTLWFALIHELHHVLFDWDDIIEKGAHVSSDEVDLYTKENMEDEANNFAKEYLFSEEKMASVRPHILDKQFVENFAVQNHIHPSIIYLFYAREQNNKGDRLAYARVKDLMPSIQKCINRLPQNPIIGKAKESAQYNKNHFFK